MRNTRLKNGFTLVELLVALMVGGVIFAAVAALAYGLSNANQATDDTCQKQAQLRYATVRIAELIKMSKLLYTASDEEIVLWIDNDENDRIDESELLSIRRVGSGNNMQLYEFRSEGEPAVLIPHCGNVRFEFDEPSLPPTKRKFVSIRFELLENGTTRQYQINASLRSWAGHLLDEQGNLLPGAF